MTLELRNKFPTSAYIPKPLELTHAAPISHRIEITIPSAQFSLIIIIIIIISKFLESDEAWERAGMMMSDQSELPESVDLGIPKFRKAGVRSGEHLERHHKFVIFLSFLDIVIQSR